MTLDAKLESILFFKGEPVNISTLAKILTSSENEILEALTLLESKLLGRGLRLIREGSEVALSTTAEASNLIESISKEELDRDLSKASLETLAIVLYRGPISRGEIEYIRGVQSTFILRSLSIRGLIERIDNPNDQRGFLYKPTINLLRYLGVGSIEDMPEYSFVRDKLAKASTANLESKTEVKE